MTTSSKITSPSPPHLTAGSALLSDWGLILVEGPDAATLLQSQLSNSVLSLQRCYPGSIASGFQAVRLVGYCNPKGRLLASAWVYLCPKNDSDEDRFVMFISKDLAASIAKRLSMYVLRSKVRVSNASDEWDIDGAYVLTQDHPVHPIATDAFALRLPDVVDGQQTFSRVLTAKPKLGNALVQESRSDLEEWNNLEVLSAIPRIVLATQEQFVPQMINFESVLGVDFQKGCYPGQEIVARSQYRGAVKRRLQLAHFDTDSASAYLSKPGDELFHSRDVTQPCGMVVLSSPSPSQPGRVNLQVECKLDALEAGEIRLGLDGPVLAIDPIPYPLLEI
ncbi:folate-binding protein [Polynucleobacter sp. TUM22923]|uniref:CAF17-like 4Fe-4S cluster assembly/insertion protein YgfZ n=1 Tax=Polynucleobacter sp. TUM22923 TaxID=3022126 RepID=UPI002573BFC4|nr:folate-binding protein [Polynucleobacter sp. TUM22923]